jgi:hypothetical protein
VPTVGGACFEGSPSDGSTATLKRSKMQNRAMEAWTKLLGGVVCYSGGVRRGTIFGSHQHNTHPPGSRRCQSILCKLVLVREEERSHETKGCAPVGLDGRQCDCEGSQSGRASWASLQPHSLLMSPIILTYTYPPNCNLIHLRI